MCDAEEETSRRQFQALENACFIRKLCKEWAERKKQGLVREPSERFQDELDNLAKVKMFEAVEKHHILENERKKVAKIGATDEEASEAEIEKEFVLLKEKESVLAEASLSLSLCLIAQELFPFRFPRKFWNDGIQWMYMGDTMYGLITDEYDVFRTLVNEFQFLHHKAS